MNIKWYLIVMVAFVVLIMALNLTANAQDDDNGYTVSAWNQNSSSGTEFRFFPFDNREDAKDFYGQGDFATLQSGGVVIGNNETAALQTEILTDILQIGVPWKWAISMGIAESEDDSAGTNLPEENLQKMLTTGGNISIDLDYPLLVYTRDNAANLLLNVGPGISFDVPPLGQTAGTEDVTWNTDLGAELVAEFNGLDGLIDFYGTARIIQVYGSPDFYAGLGYESGFAIADYTAGVELADFLRVYLSNVIMAPDEINDISSLSVGIEVISR